MDTNEIMNNEVIETTEEIVKTSSGKALKVAGGIGLAVIAGVVAYKYIVKPMVDKRKAERKRLRSMRPMRSLLRTRIPRTPTSKEKRDHRGKASVTGCFPFSFYEREAAYATVFIRRTGHGI